MPRLIFRSADGEQRTYELSATLEAGSDEGNAAVLPGAGIAGRHCRFSLDAAGAVWVEDLGSAGGTRLGGAPLAARSQVGLEVEVALGSWTVRLERPLELEIAPAAGGGRYALARDRTIIGSGPSADLALADASVSPRHAQLSRVGGMLHLLDLGSARGTFVNGARITSQTVEPGDVLCFGAVEVSFAGAAPRPPAAPRPQPEARLPAPAPRTPLAPAPRTATPAPRSATPAEPLPVAPAPARAPWGPRHWIAATGGALLLGGAAIAALTLSSPGLRPLFAASGQALVEEPPPAKASPAEKAEEGRLQQAQDLLERGEPVEAMGVLGRIPPTSPDFAQARRLYAQVSTALAGSFEKECRSDVARGAFEPAYVGSCRRVLELTCGLGDGPDPHLLARFRHAARVLGRGDGEWTCPTSPLTRPFDAAQAVLVGEPVEVLVREQYPNQRLAEVVVRYYQTGNVAEAVSLLSRLEADPATPGREAITALGDAFAVISVRQKALKRDSSPAKVAALQEAERRVLPAGASSAFLRDLESARRDPLPPPSKAAEARATGCAKLLSALKAQKVAPDSRKAYLRSSGCEPEEAIESPRRRAR